jgi:hypothetical protein
MFQTTNQIWFCLKIMCTLSYQSLIHEHATSIIVNHILAHHIFKQNHM